MKEAGIGRLQGSEIIKERIEKFKQAKKDFQEIN